MGSGDDHVVTRIEFHMVVDGKLTVAPFSRPERIAELLIEDKVTLGEWLRALRDTRQLP